MVYKHIIGTFSICFALFVVNIRSDSHERNGDYEKHLKYMEQWQNVAMPSKSFFFGFEPPTNETKWGEAKEKARTGDLALLHKLFDKIHYAEELHTADRDFRWNHKVSDLFISGSLDRKSGFDELLSNYKLDKAPIIHFGERKFEYPDHEGKLTGFDGFSPSNLVNFNKKISRKFVAIGSMDENWGWLSTQFMNR